MQDVNELEKSEATANMQEVNELEKREETANEVTEDTQGNVGVYTKRV